MTEPLCEANAYAKALEYEKRIAELEAALEKIAEPIAHDAQTIARAALQRGEK